MPRLSLVPLLLIAATLLTVPADALAACNGATRVRRAAACPPTASFTASPAQALRDQTIVFDASASTAAPPRTIVEYAWNFDEDATFEVTHGPGQPTEQHSFAANGSYDVQLRVTDSDAATHIATVRVVVSTPPVASLEISDLAPLSLDTVSLDASDSHDDADSGTIDGYAFDLDGDGDFDLETDGDTPTATTSFPTPGLRTLTVQVTDSDGATATAEQVVDVANRAPTAGLSFPSLVLSGTTATLSAAPSADLDGDVVAYAWDLDGDDDFEVAPGPAPTVAHTYPAAGTYPVAVEVTDDLGAKDVATGTVTVRSLPTAALTITPTLPQVGETVSLDASGSSDPDGPLASYSWDLDGDGVFERTTAGAATTTTAYALAASFRVRVQVTDAHGLTATVSAPLTVTAATSGEPGPGGGTPDGIVTPVGEGAAKAGGGITAGAPGAAAGGHAGAAGGPLDALAALPAGPGGGPRAATPAGPLARLDSKVIQSLRSVLRSGLRLACRGAAPAQCAVRIEVDRPTARRLGLGRSATLGAAKLTAGPLARSIKLTGRARRALARARSVRLIVKGTATSPDGGSVALARVVLARR